MQFREGRRDSREGRAWGAPWGRLCGGYEGLETSQTDPSPKEACLPPPVLSCEQQLPLVPCVLFSTATVDPAVSVALQGGPSHCRASVPAASQRAQALIQAAA